MAQLSSEHMTLPFNKVTEKKESGDKGPATQPVDKLLHAATVYHLVSASNESCSLEQASSLFWSHSIA